METWARLLSILWLIGGVSGLQWSGSDSDPIQVCSGHSIQLLWNFTLDRGEQVKHTVWRYQVEGGSEDTMVTCQDGHLLPTPPFSGRLAQHKDGGIELSCATILESGNFSIYVIVEHRNSSQTVHSKTATVNVLDTPKTQSGEIHVTTKAEAVRDVTTGAWNIHLACGNFTHLGHPPINVIWTTPRGEQLESSSYEDGAFLLALANPVLAGSYSCRIAPDLPAAHCLPPHSPLHNTEGVQVDATVARLTVMEAQQREMMDTMAEMKDTMAAERRELNDTMEAERREMNNTIAQMMDTMAQMMDTTAAERREMNNTIAQMMDTIAQMMDTTAAERREMDNTIAQMKDTMAAERREMDNTMAQMKDTMEAERREMNDTIAEMKDTMAQMKDTMAADRREMNDTIAQMMDTIAQMMDTMEAERREMNNTMAQMMDTMAQMDTMEAERREMMDTMAQMDTMAAERREMNNTMAQMMDTMAADKREMDNRTSLVQAQIDQIHRISVPVSFYTRLRDNILLPAVSILKLPMVITNQGGGYNTTTGYFTAPVSGTYFFIGTARYISFGQWTGMNLVKEGVMISYAFAVQHDGHHNTRSCHGVVDMEAGERVWLRVVSELGSYLSDSVTSFSGFRIG